jgi:hypothetical protein
MLTHMNMWMMYAKGQAMLHQPSRQQGIFKAIRAGQGFGKATQNTFCARSCAAS